MKKIFKIFMFIFLCIMLLNNIYAEQDQDEWDIHCDEASNDKTKQGCWDTVKYCWQDQESEYTGCPFDENNELYTTTKLPIDTKQFEYEDFKRNYEYMDTINKHNTCGYPSNPHDAYTTTALKMRIYRNIKYERAYAASDGDGKAVTLACYKGWLKVRDDFKDEEFTWDSSPYTAELFDIVPNKCSDCLGAAYVFKLFTPGKTTGVCSTSIVKVILSTDINYTFNRATYGEYTGRTLRSYPKSLWDKYDSVFKNNNRQYRIEDINTNPSYSLTDNGINTTTYLGVDENYVPTDDSGCPEYFNVNPTGTATNHYRVGSEPDTEYDRDFYTWITNVFTGNLKDGTAYSGCTSEDSKGYEEMKKCFEDKAADIKKYSCPSDPNNFDDLVTKFKGYQKTCKSKYYELYSKNLIGKDSMKYITMISEAVSERIDACYAKTCNVDNDKIKQYTDNTVCKNGCVEPAKDQSDSPDASCWMCVDSFKWVTEEEKNRLSSCHPESSIKKEDCYGTVTSKNCFNCLENAYKKAGLTDTQITCMRDKDTVKSRVLKAIQKASDEVDDEITQENAETASDTRSKIFKIPTPGGAGFGRSADCKETVNSTGYAIIHGLVRTVQLLAPVVAIVIAMITLIPAVTAKDEMGIKKATKTCVTIGVVLVVIEVMPYIVLLIGRILGYDLTCLL